MSLLIDKLIAELAAGLSPFERVDKLNTLAWELRDADLQGGLAYAKQAYALAQEQGYQKGIADSLISQSQYTYSDFVLALTNTYRALEYYEKTGDLEGQSRAYYTLCWAHWFADNFIEAIEFGQQAQTFAQRVNDLALEADILNNLGLAYKRAGNFELGYTVYGKALEIYRKTGDLLRENKVLINMALAYGLEGEYERAVACIEERMARKFDNLLVDGYTYLAWGQIYLGQEKYQQAAQNLRRALQIANQIELTQLSQTTLHTLGQLELAQGYPERAIPYLELALEQAIEIESNLGRYQSHQVLSDIFEQQEKYQEALLHFKQFHEVKESLFNEKNMGRLQFLQTYHDAEIARREAEIYQLKNVALEDEIKERKRLQSQLYRQATTDELTGVSNRRHFMELAQIEIKRALRHDQPLCLVLLDLDRFKVVNDTFGHDAGDHVLKTLANICMYNVRDIDIFARLGGDEFVLLLPNADSERAMQIMERIRMKLTANPMLYHENPLNVTMSFGIAPVHQGEDSLDSLLRRADQALYRAKDKGKNRGAHAE